MKARHFIVMALILAPVVGCQGQNDTEKGKYRNVDKVPDSKSDDLDGHKKDAPPKVELKGSYGANCFRDVDNFYYKKDLKFVTNDYIEYVSESYWDDKCTVGYTFKTAGTYVVTGFNEKQPSIYNTEFTQEKALILPSSQQAVDYLNSSKMCFRTDWKLNVEVDLMAIFCYSKGAKFYDILEVDAAAGTLRFGKPDAAHDASLPTRRPDKLFDWSFKKQGL